MNKLIPLWVLLVSPAARLLAQSPRAYSSTRIEVTSRLDDREIPAVAEILARYKPAVDSVMAPVLGQSLCAMSAGRPESTLSNWAADVMVEFSTEADGQRADLGIVNVGGLRANMPLGTVRRGDVLGISPFQNKLAVVYLRGQDLMSLMADIAAVGGEGVSAEVRMQISPSGALRGVTVGGQPIDPERTYRVATLDYLAEGNDRMHSFKLATQVKVSDLYTRDVMMESIRRAGTITSTIEGRITIVNR